MTINEQLERIKRSGRTGLMTHAVIGYPTLPKSQQAVLTMTASGADFIELQIPFSDPIADGSTIMRANDEALSSRVNANQCLEFAADLSKQVEQPLLFMAYYNTIFSYGVKAFCQQAKKAGVQGLIVPDMPVDEEQHEQLIKNCRLAKLNHILVLSPNITQERLRVLARFQDGFVYCTARTGTTGVQEVLSKSLPAKLSEIRRHISVPIAVGFGVSKAAHLHQLRQYADIAVIGSALVEKIDAGADSVKSYLRTLKAGTI